MRVHAIFGRRADVALFAGPLLVAALTVMAHGVLGYGPEVGVLGWLVFVVGVDVAHVWSTLWVSILHRGQREAHGVRFAAASLAIYATGVAVHATLGAGVFWRVVAYAACFHFVRQQIGWVHLARSRAKEFDVVGARLDAAITALAALEPLAYWHVHGRSFGWLVVGDFVSLPPWTLDVVRLAYAAVALAFLLREGLAWRRGDVHLGKLLVVGSTALGWHWSIERGDSDFAFTAFNVTAHAAPYVYLVATRAEASTFAAASRKGLAAALVFVAVLAGFALLEEGLWDSLVWGEHGFPAPPRWALNMASAIVPLLALPQLVHYALDAVLWRRHHVPTLRQA